MKMVCVGHAAPSFDVGQDFFLVAPPGPDVKCDLEVPDDYFGARFHGGILAEYTQLFAFAEYLRIHPELEKFYIFQYRKFVSLRQPANISQNMAYCYTADASQSAGFFPTQAELDQLGTDYLFSPCVGFSTSITNGYALSHVIEDLVCFAMALREVAGFDRERCDRFINSFDMIPAPSLGMITAPIFLKNMEILWAAWDIYSQHYLKKREGYQRRVGGFLLERLNSFLLIEQFKLNPIAPATWGYQVTVSETSFVEKTR